MGSWSHPQVPGSHTQPPQVCVEPYRLVHAPKGICTQEKPLQCVGLKLFAMLHMDIKLMTHTTDTLTRTQQVLLQLSERLITGTDTLTGDRRSAHVWQLEHK